jgi:hypothetical protein
MNWWVRFALWASLLFPLAWLGLDAWHALLAPCVSWGLTLLGIHFDVESLDLLAPYDLAFFLAMVLATSAVPWKDRLAAALIGVPALIAAEVIFATLATFGVLRGELGHPLPAAAIRARDMIAATFPWVMPPIAWIALLGHTLPAFAVPPAGKRNAARKAATKS